MRKKKACVKIILNSIKPSVFESKAGGLGYIPHDGDFPCDQEGNQLRLLAQMDCAQVGFPPFPESGLLQFWILNDELYGGIDITEQNTFRVIYYPETDPTVTRSEIQAKMKQNDNDYDDEYFPVLGEYGMSFYPGESTKLDWDEPEEETETESIYHQKNHQIGGYPFFTQSDPRSENDPHDFLLFQLDSEFRNHQEIVLWGDCGVANFFINTEKLKKLDFTDVLYHWDCC